MKNYQRGNSAFTLIELAIIIVIIGLITAAVLGAQSLIESSKINAQVAQLEEFDKATNAFVLEYDALPGDIERQEALDYGFSVSGYQHLVHNGNGKINMRGNGNVALTPRQSWEGVVTTSYEFLGEQEFYFVHLSEAKLINSTGLTGWTLHWEPYEPNVHYPETKIGERAITSASDKSGRTHYIVGIDHAYRTTYGFNRAESFEGFIPKVAYKIDKKLDNGIPNTGRIKAIRWDNGIRVEGVAGDNASAPYHSDCVTDSNANRYNLSESEPSCVLWIRANSL